MTKIDFKYNIKDNIKIKSINILGFEVGGKKAVVLENLFLEKPNFLKGRKCF